MFLPLKPPTPTSTCSRSSSPDYASTGKSDEDMEQPRRMGGERKVIGDPNLVEQEKMTAILDIDFGLTPSLTPNSSRPVSRLASRPSTAAAGRLSPFEFEIPSDSQIPSDENKPYVGRVTPPTSQPPPPQLPPQSQLPSPTQQHTRYQYPQKHQSLHQAQSRPPPPPRPSSQMWHPGRAGGRQSPAGLSAEEFVQQRASLARYPSGYVQRRSMSSGKIEQVTPPASPNRVQTTNRSRPTSRGSLLDFSSNLSAREQEHVAKITGSPLLNLQEQSKVPDPNVGLIGAIQTREQQKQYVKDGVSGHMVQAAIASRQQQAQAQQMQQMQAQYQQQVNAWNQRFGTPYTPAASAQGARYWSPQQLQQRQVQQPLQQQYYQNQQYQQPYSQSQQYQPPQQQQQQQPQQGHFHPPTHLSHTSRQSFGGYFGAQDGQIRR